VTKSATACRKSCRNRAYLAKSRAHFPPALPDDSVRCYALFTVLMLNRVRMMEASDAEPGGRTAIWKPVIRPQYAAARRRHAMEREEAYAIARDVVLARGSCDPGLHFADIETSTLEVWHRTWSGVHPSGAGKWNWPGLVEQLPHRAAVLPIAIWYGDDLCGMALGQASRRRTNGSRHTVTLTHIERRPEPPGVPLRGEVVSLAVEVALRYALAIGARRLRLRNPDVNLLKHYEVIGFKAVWRNGIPVYCEREV
jgi:hypothetical protein